MNQKHLDGPSRQALLERARAAIASTIGIEQDAPLTASAPVVHAGAFVTLRVRGDLRGCIGYTQRDRLLADVVEHCAVSAAVGDPRFDPVSASEWPHIDLEISVLGPVEPVRDIREVEIGRHGLMIELGRRRGLLLPQVAMEWSWKAEEFAA